MRGYLAYRTDKEFQEIVHHATEFQSLIDKLITFKSILSPKQKEALNHIKELREKFASHVGELFSIHASEKWQQDAYIIKTEISPLLQHTQSLLKELETIETNKINNAVSNLSLQIITTIIASIISIIIILFLSKFIVAVLIKSIVTPLKKAVKATGKIASGDLTVQIDEISDDEFGELLSSLNTMASNLSELILQVQQSGIQVASSSTQISATAKQQEATMVQQSTTATEINDNSKAITTTVHNLVNIMNEVIDATEKTGNETEDSQIALMSLENAMNKMKEVTSDISSKLSVLSEKAQNITGVITTITKVADQTNLLSLNAAIEAEKAGEYGVGFSVVATEIRRLADQTAVATWDIEKMVKDIQNAVSSGVMGVEKFSEEMRNGVNAAQNVNIKLSSVITQIQDLLPNFDVVFKGIQNQAQGAQQISDSISMLSEGTQQTTESLRQSNSAIHQLNNSADKLQKGVSKFQIKKREKYE